MEIEEKTDYKTCTPEVLYEARKTVIKMWKKDNQCIETSEARTEIGRETNTYPGTRTRHYKVYY